MTNQTTTKACHGRTNQGKPCRMAPLRGSVYCFNHDPAKRQAQAQARRAGGLARHTPHAGNLETIPADVQTIDQARGILNYALQELLVMDNGIARARALIALFDSFVKAFEIGELEKRIAALEGMNSK